MTKRINIFFIVFILVSLISFITALEFSALPYNNTWGSDAEYYYISAIDSTYNQSCTEYLAYGYVCLLSSLLSLIDLPVLWYFSFCVIYISLVFIYYIPNNIYSKHLLIIIYFNPIIIWTFLKGVKESLVILTILCLVVIYKRKQRDFLFYILSYFFLSILSTVKFESVAFYFLAFVLTEVILKVKNKIKVFYSIMCISILTLFFLDALSVIFPEFETIKKLLSHRELFLTLENSFTDENPNIILSVFRFLLGPGPVTPLTALFINTDFYEPTIIGLLLIFLGSALWLYVLARSMLIFYKLVKHSNRIELIFSKFEIFSSFLAFNYILTYSYMYGGMVDTRHRAVVYFLLSPILFRILNLKYKNYS